MLTGVASATPVVQIATPVIGVCHPSGRLPYAETYFLLWCLLDNKLAPNDGIGVSGATPGWRRQISCALYKYRRLFVNR